MKGIKYFIVFLVLSASLMCTSEAARSRTSNQNSFRRAANGIYQTLSSVFGEENIKGLYKVRYELVFPNVVILARRNQHVRRSMVNGGKETSALRPDHPFNRCHFGLSALSCFKWYIDVGHSTQGWLFPDITLELLLNGGHSLLACVASVHRCKWAPLVQPVCRPKKIRFPQENHQLLLISLHLTSVLAWTSSLWGRLLFLHFETRSHPSETRRRWRHKCAKFNSFIVVPGT